MQIEVVDSLATIPAQEWDLLVVASQGNVFLTHAYLHSLQTTGCVGKRTGWTPRHLLARDEMQTLIGAMPLYLKTHSYGEYVFDWAWADAYRRAGGEYYPKLLAAVPFTPCTGPRVLAADDETRLAFELATVDTTAHRMTVRECLWNAEPGNPAAPIVWGAMRTVSLIGCPPNGGRDGCIN